MTAKNSRGNNGNIRTRGAVIVTHVSASEQDRHGSSPESQLDACRVKALALCYNV